MSPGSGVDGSLSLTDVFKMSDLRQGVEDVMIQDSLNRERGYRIYSVSIHNDPYKFDPGVAKVDLEIGGNRRNYALYLARMGDREVFDYAWEKKPFFATKAPHQIANHVADILENYYGLPMGFYAPILEPS